MRHIGFHLRTLIAKYEDSTGERLSYRDLARETGVSTTTITALANNDRELVSLRVLESLCAFFDCELRDLMRLEPPAEEQA
jgi:DNA-binding Xre family transcriptional regulator